MTIPAPTFSVLVPAYGTEAFIADLIESVLAQTRSDWELIVVDDASEDRLCDRVLPYLVDERIHLIRLDRNRGPSHARNVAARAAHGRLLSFVDSDDLLRPEFLHQMATAIEAMANPGVVGCAWTVIDEVGEPVPSSGSPSLLVSTDSEAAVLHLLRGPFGYSAMTLQRSTFDDMGGFDEEIWLGEDLELWVRVAVTGRAVRVVADPLYVVRDREESLSRSAIRAVEIHEAALATLALIANRVVMTSARQKALDEHVRRSKTGLAAARYRIAARQGDARLARRSASQLMRLRPSMRAMLMLAATALQDRGLSWLYSTSQRLRGLKVQSSTGGGTAQ